jgi:hypothetical protein
LVGDTEPSANHPAGRKSTVEKLAKHGPGPHNVKSTVAYTNPDDSKIHGIICGKWHHWTLCRHSVDFFGNDWQQDLGQYRVFCITKTEHVLAAALIDYKTKPSNTIT